MVLKSHRISLPFALLSFLATLVSSDDYPTTCYVLDGQHNAAAGFRCNNGTSGHSSCCGAGAICYSNGVCQQSNGPVQDYLRVGCTDPTWKDPACVDQCTIYANDSTAGIRFCNGAITSTNQYCCDDGSQGVGSFACCNTPSAIFEINPIPTVIAQVPLSYIPTTTSSSSSATTSTTSVSSPASAPATSTPPTNPANTPRKTSHIPLILGVTIPLAALAVLLAVFLFYRQNRAQRRRISAHNLDNSPSASSPYYQDTQTGPSEAEGSTPMLDANGKAYWGGREYLRTSDPAEMEGERDKGRPGAGVYEMEARAGR